MMKNVQSGKQWQRNAFLQLLRGRSQTLLIKFSPFLTTFLPLVHICEGISFFAVDTFRIITYLPCLANIVFECP